MKLPITLSINPIYFCNFDCHFCYLTQDQLNDKKLLSLEKLSHQVQEVETLYQIDCIDIYGGEIALLQNEYLDKLIEISLDKASHINLITNLSVIHPSFYRKDVNVSVSWEGDIRRKSEEVYKNIGRLGRDVNLLMLAGPEMLCWSNDEIQGIIQKISLLQNIKSVEIKPYSSNQSNDLALSHSAYEEHIKKWLHFGSDMNFVFVNEENLKNVFSGSQNSFSDDHLYIGPDGEFAVLDFDKDDKEYFLKLSRLEDYMSWANMEKMKISQNSFCSTCEYLGNCLSEHLRDVTSIESSCNGYYKLISWYKEAML